MSPEEKIMLDIYHDSIDVANKFGPLIIEETDGFIPVTTTATALMLANFCIRSEISLHDAVDLLMSSYKQTLALQEEEE